MRRPFSGFAVGVLLAALTALFVTVEPDHETPPTHGEHRLLGTLHVQITNQPGKAPYGGKLHVDRVNGNVAHGHGLINGHGPIRFVATVLDPRSMKLDYEYVDHSGSGTVYAERDDNGDYNGFAAGTTSTAGKPFRADIQLSTR